MRKIKYSILILSVLAINACASFLQEKESIVTNSPDVCFFCEFEDFGNETKTYLDANYHTRWERNDTVSIFSTTDNLKYSYNHISQTSGYFTKCDDSAIIGTALPAHYSIYPYSANNSISADGIISFDVPSIQYYYGYDSFESGACPMVAVTKDKNDNHLRFKNICGFLRIPLYGKGIIKSITLYGNSSENLAGNGTVVASHDGNPEFSFGNSTKTFITLDCGEGYKVSASEEHPSTFWFVLPPTVFEKGFSIDICDIRDSITTISTSERREVERNSIYSMAPKEISCADLPLWTDMEEIRGEMASIFTDIGRPAKMFDDLRDWESLLVLYCNDLEGADAHIIDNGYNWFSDCGMLERGGNHRNSYIRFYAPWNLIKEINEFFLCIPDYSGNRELTEVVAQLRALRAFSYLNLAREFQFNYQVAGDKPCVPIITDNSQDDGTLTRATVKDVYDFILEDLDFAVKNLEGSERRSKAFIDGNVAHGLRARVYLDMGEWQKAYDDAVAAAQGYIPASIEEVSVPSFMSIDEHNWIWGYDMTAELTEYYIYATSSSWLRSFSGFGYATNGQAYTCINNILWNKIPATDIRKQWWVDENLQSTISDKLVWPGLGPVATADIGEGVGKRPFIPFTNVKFGCNPIATQTNEEDTPLMRVEEMILIQAECLYWLGQVPAAVDLLTSFVKTCRDSEYVYDESRSFIDEIWFQRRVELWGEGFFIPDQRRLGKPVVRFHDESSSNLSPAFTFNIAADDPWVLLRFPGDFLEANPGVIDNNEGSLPSPLDNRELRDGVTD